MRTLEDDVTAIPANVMAAKSAPDGIHASIPYEQVSRAIQKHRDAYALKANAPFLQWDYALSPALHPDNIGVWQKQGMPMDIPFDKLFQYDEPQCCFLDGLGWCDRPPYVPFFEEQTVEVSSEHQVRQNRIGVRMHYIGEQDLHLTPAYVEYPVTDQKSWEENCKWRLIPQEPKRYEALAASVKAAQHAASQGMFIIQNIMGGYLFLQRLFGNEELLFMVCEHPALVHDCMRTWLELADHVVAYHQRFVSLDQLAFCELDSQTSLHRMATFMQEFIVPYYQQLVANVKSRQLDPRRKVNIFLKTQDYEERMVSIFRSIGLTAVGTFGKSGIVSLLEFAEKFPDLVICGGVQRDILKQGKEAIDSFIDRVFPVLQKRGGYIPFCDSFPLSQISYSSYMHYRRRALEFA